MFLCSRGGYDDTDIRDVDSMLLGMRQAFPSGNETYALTYSSRASEALRVFISCKYSLFWHVKKILPYQKAFIVFGV